MVGCSKALLTARYGSTVRRLKLSARRARMITLLVSQQGRFRFQALNEALQGHSSPLSGDNQGIPSRSATAEHVNYLLI